MKKIGLLSDTHGYWDEKFEKYFSNCHEIWHAGDIGDINIMDKLSQITKVRGVFGNIDDHIVRAEFPLNQRFILEKVDVWITHIGGTPYSYYKKIRDEMTQKEREQYDKKIYANLTEEQLEAKRDRQKKWYYEQKDNN